MATTTKRNTPLLIMSRLAGGTINRGRGVALHTDGKFYQYDGSTYTTYVGVAMETYASGDIAEVITDGIGIFEAGATLDEGISIGLDANGKAVPIASGVSTNLIVGNAGYSATSGNEVEIILNAQNIVSPATSGHTFKMLAIATFDPSANASERTIAAHGLGVSIPDNAIISRAWYEVLTTFTSAGADAGTIAIHTESANDMVTATAISAGGNIWDAGLHEAIQDGTAANMIKMTSANEITATVAVQALTAGKLRIYVEYVQSI